MGKLSNGLAAFAAFGLVVAGPAAAQTRAAQALPAASAQLDRADVARGNAPLAQASELGGRSSPIVLGIIALLALLIAAAGGGGGGNGGGGNDSPG